MGVRGLQTFMENNPHVAYEVNIKDIVEVYRRETGRDVVIVVDGSSCLRHLYGSLDWVCGGQIKEYVEAFKTFIKTFVDIGVKLVFFFDGPTQPRKRNVWVERRIRSLKDAYKVFDLISEGVHPRNISIDSLMLPPATTYLARFAIQTSSGCELHTSINECDEEIAQYARQYDCFAILGQDSDYAIYDGPQYYLSIKHLNLEKLATINYNRWALARELRIAPGLLPLFASLVGNDIVRADDLIHFHKRICYHKKPFGRPNPRNVMYNVARFICHHTNENDLFQALPLISRKVFGNEQRASQLHLSIRSYSVHFTQAPYPQKFNIKTKSTNPQQHWKNIQRYAEMRMKTGNLDTMVYAIMHGLPYESSTGLEDFRRAEMPPSASVYKPLRQHIYGIILLEHPGNTPVVNEWCMQGEQSLAEAESVPVILPKQGSHPGLLALWNEEDKSKSMLNKKWELVAQSISKRLDPDKLKVVPPTLVAPTLLLFLLRNELSTPFLETWEVESLIATAVMVPTYTTSSLAALHLEKVVPRAVQVACIFNRGGSIIKMLMDACGTPIPALEVSLWHYFDGKLFQTLYQKAQGGCKIIELCNNRVAQLEEFNLLRSIIFLN